jgi:hypothetical protein
MAELTEQERAKTTRETYILIAVLIIVAIIVFVVWKYKPFS